MPKESRLMGCVFLETGFDLPFCLLWMSYLKDDRLCLICGLLEGCLMLRRFECLSRIDFPVGVC